jgi:hypothetical protein
VNLERLTVRILAGICVVLGLLCLALAASWTRKDDEARCWRQALEDNATPSAVDCRP